MQLSHKEREELDNMVNSYKHRGVRMIIYATRALTEAETNRYNQ